MDDRKKALELFAKELSQGLPFAEDYIEKTPDIELNSLRARDLSEDALAQQVLNNTGIPIPDNGASLSKKEDFLNRIIAERYPEFKGNPNLKIGNEDSFYKGNILVNDRHDLTTMTGKALHEAGHKYDSEILNHQGKNLDLADLRKAKASGMDLKNMDPAQVYEMYAKNHHAKIPNLREGSFGLGALKSMMKNGTFKGIAPIGIGAALTAAALPEDASASDFIPGLDQAENAGSSMDDKMIQTEVKARQNYDSSPARLDALKKLAQSK